MIEKDDAKKVVEVMGNNLIGVSHDSKNFQKLPDNFWGYFARGHEVGFLLRIILGIQIANQMNEIILHSHLFL